MSLSSPKIISMIVTRKNHVIPKIPQYASKSGHKIRPTVFSITTRSMIVNIGTVAKGLQIMRLEHGNPNPDASVPFINIFLQLFITVLLNQCVSGSIHTTLQDCDKSMY